MQTWARRVRGAIGMGVAWAAGWAVVGILIGVASTLLPGAGWDAFFKVFDAPLPALAVPGFFGGVIFSTASATASLALARKAEKQEFLPTTEPARAPEPMRGTLS